MKKVELLSPAGDWETLAAAIEAGADSVYFGIKWINMRASSARNFDISELKKIMEKLHSHHVKGCLTLNTVIYDHEIERVKKILHEAKKAKVDAIIATDLTVIQLCHEKNLEVHVSTQLSVANYEAVKFFSQFSSRIVLARECTLEQIKEIKRKIIENNLNFKGKQIELETFVHGSLCVAYSGRCFMSQHHNRLSANRGQCLQECRRQYKLTDISDPRREFIVDHNYMMSPKDLCALPILDQLIDVGIDVFKIEGRAKGPDYVYVTTTAYREALCLIEEGKFTPKKAFQLVKNLEAVFNRGFTDNFYLGTPTNNSWTTLYGSGATEQKVRVGKVTNYFPQAEIVSVRIEENELKEGEEACFIGPTTGYYRVKVAGLRMNNQPVKMAGLKSEVSFKVDKKLRTSDVAYVIRRRDPEKERYTKQYESIGVHKPFKNSKNKKGII